MGSQRRLTPWVSTLTNMPQHSPSSSDDIEVYGDHDPGHKPLASHSSQDSHHNTPVDDSEEAFEVEQPTHGRRRSGSVHSTSIEEPFTHAERVFMLASAVLVASLTVVAVTVVLSKAEL